MNVNAYPVGLGTLIELGSVADAIWVGGFKFSEERTLQISKPMNAAAPNIFDRLMRTQNFQFAAGRSFSGSGASPVAAALQFLGTHPASVPGLADIQFTAQGGEIWLRSCGIQKVELIDKKSAYVAFSYSIIGGTWALTRN